MKKTILVLSLIMGFIVGLWFVGNVFGGSQTIPIPDGNEGKFLMVSSTAMSGVSWETVTGGSGITSLNSLTDSSQTFATSTDTNLGMTIGSVGAIHSFTPVWIGTLADSRISSAFNWNSKATSSITISAGTGLTGGGDLTANRTLTLNMAGASCGGTDKVRSISATGTVICAVDETGAGAATYVVTTENSSSTASTSYQDIVGMSWTVASSTRYDIECRFIYDSSVNTIGLGISWTNAVAPVRSVGQMVESLSGGATVAGTSVVGNDTGGTTLSSVGTVNNTATFQGLWHAGTTDGTLQMRFRPETATAGGTTIKPGSFCKYSTY